MPWSQRQRRCQYSIRQKEILNRIKNSYIFIPKHHLTRAMLNPAHWFKTLKTAIHWSYQRPPNLMRDAWVLSLHRSNASVEFMRKARVPQSELQCNNLANCKIVHGSEIPDRTCLFLFIWSRKLSCI